MYLNRLFNAKPHYLFLFNSGIPPLHSKDAYPSLHLISLQPILTLSFCYSLFIYNGFCIFPISFSTSSSLRKVLFCHFHPLSTSSRSPLLSSSFYLQSIDTCCAVFSALQVLPSALSTRLSSFNFLLKLTFPETNCVT